MTKREARDMAKALAAKIDGGRQRDGTTHVGTWMDRPGVSLTVHLDSKRVGRRVVVHKWDDETTCEVRLIAGDFWRPRNENEIGQEFARVDDVVFDVDSITAAANEIVS